MFSRIRGYANDFLLKCLRHCLNFLKYSLVLWFVCFELIGKYLGRFVEFHCWFQRSRIGEQCLRALVRCIMLFLLEPQSMESLSCYLGTVFDLWCIMISLYNEVSFVPVMLNNRSFFPQPNPSVALVHSDAASGSVQNLCKWRAWL